MKATYHGIQPSSCRHVVQSGDHNVKGGVYNLLLVEGEKVGEEALVVVVTVREAGGEVGKHGAAPPPDCWFCVCDEFGEGIDGRAILGVVESGD